MKISKKTAQKLWKETYGDRKLVKDFSGKYMYFNAYGDSKYSRNINGKNIQCGWNIDHILPKSRGGKNAKSNLACTNFATNQAKADKITFCINGTIFQVKKTDDGYVNSRI